MSDSTSDVLTAAAAAVRGLSPAARRRLADGAGFVRLSAYDARRLIAAVDELDAGIDEQESDRG